MKTTRKTPQTETETTKFNFIGIFLEKFENYILFRLDKKLLLHYTIGVTGACVQAFGTPTSRR